MISECDKGEELRMIFNTLTPANGQLMLRVTYVECSDARDDDHGKNQYGRHDSCGRKHFLDLVNWPHKETSAGKEDNCQYCDNGPELESRLSTF